VENDEMEGQHPAASSRHVVNTTQLHENKPPPP